MARLSIIMPVLDEGEGFAAALDALADLRALGTEVIVVDGGSSDATVQRARLRADRVITVAGGRATQLNAGADAATGDVLLFLNAKTRLPPAADHLILDGLARSGRAWGRFDVATEDRSKPFATAARLINLRSRLTGIPTSDQAMFVTRAAFRGRGGFPADAPKANAALAKRLKHVSKPLYLADQAVISGRHWEHDGLLRAVLRR